MLCAKRKLLWTDFNVDAAVMILRFTFNENIDQFEINKYEKCLMKLKFKRYSYLKSKRDEICDQDFITTFAICNNKFDKMSVMEFSAK